MKGERRALPTMHEGTPPPRVAKDTSLLASASPVAAECAHPTQRLLSAEWIGHAHSVTRGGAASTSRAAAPLTLSPWSPRQNR